MRVETPLLSANMAAELNSQLLELLKDTIKNVVVNLKDVKTIEEEAQTEFDLMIYVANWPERRSHAWKTLLCARAIENQSYVVGVNRVGKDGNEIYHSGNSMVVDPLGEVLYHNADDEDIFTITLEKDHLDNVRTKFPFWKDGDLFRIEG